MTISLKTKALDLSLSFKIALDGPAASGKGTLGKALAREFGLEFFSSGSLYRNLAYLCLDEGIEHSDLESVIKKSSDPSILSINPENYSARSEEIGNYASKIAGIKEVRENLNILQRNLIKSKPRILTEGRDIGTIIAPDSDLKLYLEASAEVRALRRYKQLRLEGKNCILADVFDDLVARDRRDSFRGEAPLRPASDALVIDTSELSLEEALSKIEDYILK